MSKLSLLSWPKSMMLVVVVVSGVFEMQKGYRHSNAFVCKVEMKDSVLAV